MVPKFLIVAATSFETKALATHFNISIPSGEGLLTAKPGSATQLSILTTGVGMVNTAYALGRCADEGFDYVINAGICGAFNRSIALGEVVHIVSDTLSEMGAQDDEQFLRYHELNLGGTNIYQSTANKNLPVLNTLKRVNGITVNKVHGHAASIQAAVSLFNPDVESMEGAAFFRSCAHFKGSCLQVRAVSNYVEKRDKSQWNIPLALANLDNFLIRFINTLNA